MTKFKKAIALGVMIFTVLSLCAVVAPAQAATAKAGDLIKMDGLSSVYYLGADGKRYVFPNEKTYFSWYSDFSKVVTISQSELENLPLGKNVTTRPGTKLVKITTSPKVYAVTQGGVLMAIDSEATAKALYGDTWAQRVIDVPDAFFTNYTISNQNVSATAYPAGSLVKFGTAADIYYIAADGKAQKFVSMDAFNANGFKTSDVITSTLTMPAAGADITGQVAILVDTASGAGGTAGAGTGLTVALSATTPASGNIVGGQARASIATFNLTASNDGAVKVTTFKVKRGGFSTDTTLSALYLYEGTNRLTDSASVSSGYITWNNASGIVTVPAGTTKTITVVADVAEISNGSVSGETVNVSVNAAADVTTDGASVTGSFPATGNMMSVASATLATVAFNASTLPAANTALDSGQTGYTLWKNTVSVGNRKVYLDSVRFRQIGSVSAADVKNFQFFVDGVLKGDTMQLGSDNYMTFNFATPVELQTGSRILEVRGDLIDGSNKTFSLSVQYAVDVAVRDADYNANIKVTGVPATAGTQTISVGSLTVVASADSPSGNVVKDSTGVTLAKYDFKAYGEPIKVEYLKAKVAFSGNPAILTKLRNGALYVNNVQIGSTADLTLTGATFNLGSSLVVTPGTPVVVEVRGDIYASTATSTNNQFNSDDKVTVTLVQYTNAGQKTISLGYTDVPAADKAASQVTVKIGSMTLSQFGNYGAQNVVLPKTAFKVGSYVLTGNSSEAVNLNNIEVDFATTSGASFVASTDLTDLFVKVGSTELSRKSSVSATNNFSTNVILDKNASVIIDVYASIVSGSITDDHTFRSQMIVSGTTANSGTAVNTTGSGNPLNGQIMTAKSGSMTVAVDGTTADTALVKAGTALNSAVFKFSAANDDFTVTKIVATTSDASAIASASLLVDGVAVTGSTVYFSGTTATFAGLNIAVPANTTKKVTVVYNLGNVGTGAGTTQSNAIATLSTYDRKNGAGVTTADVAVNLSGNAQYVVKSIPTIEVASFPTTTLVAGTNVFAKFTIAGDGEISWKKILFTVSSSTAVVDTTSYKLFANGVEVAGTAAVSGNSVTFVANNEQLVAGSKTYELRASVTGGVSTGASITTNIAQPETAVIKNDYATVLADVSQTFVWSDESAQSHDTTTADWFGSYLVKNLATASQGLSK